MITKNDFGKLVNLYTNIRETIEKSSTGEVRGRLVISRRGNKIQFYHSYFDSKDGQMRVYLGKDKLNLIKALAQKQYNNKVRKIVEKRERQLTSLLKEYEDGEIELIYENLSPERKQLVTPFVISFEDQLEMWKAQPYQGKGFEPDCKIIYTKKGERVRSKSEKIMSDRFFDLGIEYKYECPLFLKDGIRLYPDFTFLSPITGEEIYWEHNGMVDDPTYAINMIKKVTQYEKNGIFRGKNLIVTYESSNFNLDYTWMDVLIKKYLKP